MDQIKIPVLAEYAFQCGVCVPETCVSGLPSGCREPGSPAHRLSLVGRLPGLGSVFTVVLGPFPPARARPRVHGAPNDLWPAPPSSHALFSRQEYWSRLPGDHPNPGIKPLSLASSALAVGSLPLVPPAKSLVRSGTEIQNHQRHCEGLIHVDSISFSGSINPQLLLYGSLCICRKPTKHHCF